MDDKLSVEQLAEMAKGAGVASGTHNAAGEKTEPTAVDLSSLTGNRFSTVEDLNAFLVDYDQTVAQLNELKAKTSVSPFVNPLVEKLNEVFKTGTKDDARVYFDLAYNDLQSMDALDVIRMDYKFRFPSMATEQIDALIFSEIGVTDDMAIDALPALQAAKLIAEKQKAIEALSTKKVSYETVVAPVVDPAEVAESNRIVTSWKDTLLPNMPKVVQITLPAEENIPAYSVSYNPKPEVIAAVDQQLQQIIASNPRQFPLTREGLAAITELRNNLIRSFDFNNLMQHVIRDVYAGAIEAATKRNAGPQPSAPGAQNPTATPSVNVKSVGWMGNVKV